MSKTEHVFIITVKDYSFTRLAFHIDTKDLKTSIEKIIAYNELKLYKV